jgi:hypothetical protein
MLGWENDLLLNNCLPFFNLLYSIKQSGLRCAAVVLRNCVGRSRVRFPMVSLEFSIDIILSSCTVAPGVDSASNRNEYQEYFLGGKGGRCIGLTTLSPSCADCLEIWEPQPRGTPQGLCRSVMGLLYLYLYIKPSNEWNKCPVREN